jgi:hypothetical protein
MKVILPEGTLILDTSSHSIKFTGSAEIADKIIGNLIRHLSHMGHICGIIERKQEGESAVYAINVDPVIFEKIITLLEERLGKDIDEGRASLYVEN